MFYRCDVTVQMCSLCRICRRGLLHLPMGAQRACGLLRPLRRRLLAVSLLAAGFLYTILLIAIGTSTLSREDMMESKLVHMQAQIAYMESLYRQEYEYVLALQSKIQNSSKPVTRKVGQTTPTELVKKYAGTKTGNSFDNLKPLRMPVLYHIMPHLMASADSIRPAFHLTAGRHFVDVVIGVPTVKRDKSSYWLDTLQSLVDKLSDKEAESTLIVLFVGETDLEYVANISSRIEYEFSKEVTAGLIEVIAPSPSFYPDFENLPLTLGDSPKRVKWRTKQNLDTIYLMGYAQAKGTYYLMLEDDVLAKDNYMQQIKNFSVAMTLKNPNWFYIDFCSIGGIGKFFRSSDLIRFITYVQLFYNNLPIDWLLEGYLADKVCSNVKYSKDCSAKKLEIRPKYKIPLFEHIGLYSSLKGKIQDGKVKGGLDKLPEYFPHTNNPPVESIKSSIESQTGHSIEAAYNGETFYWGMTPLNGTTIEFNFKTPIMIERYVIRSGNVKHKKDRFYSAIVEVQPLGGNYTYVGDFDEFGLAEGQLAKNIGPVSALRIRVLKSSTYWALISEIEIKEFNEDAR